MYDNIFQWFSHNKHDFQINYVNKSYICIFPSIDKSELKVFLNNKKIIPQS